MKRFQLSIVAIGALFACAPSGTGATATVGVYYFEGWYHDTPEAIAAFANAELRNDFPEREPIWGGGLWRGDTVAIMEQQIDLAADHGIAFFSFDWYWYGNPAATSNDGINSGLKHFMLASNRSRMKFNITIVDAPPTTINSDAEWAQVADMLVPYLADAQYLRVGGKPLVINFNAAGMTQTNHDYFQQAAAGAGLNAVAFAANVAGSTALYSHLTRYNAVPGWGAGETQYPYQSLTEFVEGNDTWAAGIWNTESGGPQSYIPIVMAGWDARPWGTPPSWYFNDPAWGHTPAAVGAHLQKAIDWIDAHPALATPERLVMIFAWNEFGEGGYIAPTLGDPEGLYLDAIKAVVGVPVPPVVRHGVGATGVTDTAAWLTGELSSTLGTPTAVHIEWGSLHGTADTTLVYSVDGPFSVHVGNLVPDTDYAYHCRASNANGTSGITGLEWFTTAAEPPFVDADGDGLDDNWENRYFGSVTNTAGGADEDADEDRFIDRFEFRAGTDPTNPASLLAITELGRPAASNIVIRWHGVSNKHYTLSMSPNLLPPWWPVISNIPASPPVNARTVTVENTPIFYRVELDE